MHKEYAFAIRGYGVNWAGLRDGSGSSIIGLNLFRDHLGKMPGLAKFPKADLSKGFTVAQVAEKLYSPV